MQSQPMLQEVALIPQEASQNAPWIPRVSIADSSTVQPPLQEGLQMRPCQPGLTGMGKEGGGWPSPLEIKGYISRQEN